MPSWRGKANPTGAFANEKGNRLKFGVHISTTGGSKFTLADVSWTHITKDQNGVDQVTTLGNLTFGSNGTNYDGVKRYGIDWGLDGVKGGGDDIIYNSGEAGTTKVNELIYFGLGRAWTENDTISGTDQEKIDNTYYGLNGWKDTVTYTINGETNSSSVNFSAIPEPSSTTLIGLAGLALLFHRRK